jgi:hypothetical protein
MQAQNESTVLSESAVLKLAEEVLDLLSRSTVCWRSRINVLNAARAAILGAEVRSEDAPRL